MMAAECMWSLCVIPRGRDEPKKEKKELFGPKRTNRSV